MVANISHINWLVWVISKLKVFDWISHSQPMITRKRKGSIVCWILGDRETPPCKCSTVFLLLQFPFVSMPTDHIRFSLKSSNLDLWFKILELGSVTGLPFVLVHFLLPRMAWGRPMPLFFSLGIHSLHPWLFGRSLAFGNEPLGNSSFPNF